VCDRGDGVDGRARADGGGGSKGGSEGVARRREKPRRATNEIEKGLESIEADLRRGSDDERDDRGVDEPLEPSDVDVRDVFSGKSGVVLDIRRVVKLSRE